MYECVYVCVSVCVCVCKIVSMFGCMCFDCSFCWVGTGYTHYVIQSGHCSSLVSTNHTYITMPFYRSSICPYQSYMHHHAVSLSATFTGAQWRFCTHARTHTHTHIHTHIHTHTHTRSCRCTAQIHSHTWPIGTYSLHTHTHIHTHTHTKVCTWNRFVRAFLFAATYTHAKLHGIACLYGIYPIPYKTI